MTNGLCLILAAILALPPFDSAQGRPFDSAQGKPQEGTSSRPNGGGESSRQLLNPDDLPVDFEKIQRAIEREPAIRVEQRATKFRVEIFGDKPTIEEILGPDWAGRPVPHGSLSHQEFLKMVTPRDFYSSAGIKPTEMLQFAVTNWLGQTLIKQAIEEMLRARTDRERDEIRARIDRELAALMAGQGKTQ